MKTIGGFLLVILFILPNPGWTQGYNRVVFKDMEQKNSRRQLAVPNLNGYITLKGDFHIHTVFSDGSVWPDVRVDEAWSDGLDAIAITEHDTYRPHQEYMKSDQNTSFNVARNYARDKGVILIQAIEVTRWKMPPGHLNALFVADANIPELQDTSRSALLTSIEKLHRQGAFILWNHPGWDAQQRDTVKWFDLHQLLLDKGWLNGIEVFNYNEWYPIALHWAMEKRLTPFANSDIHQPIRWTYDYSGNFIRPMTLVFAKEKSEAGIKEAMVQRRTVAWFNDNLAGAEVLLSPLFDKTIGIYKFNGGDKTTTYELVNSTDLFVDLKILNKGDERQITIGRRSSVHLTLPTTVKSLKVEVVNWHTELGRNLQKDIVLN